jgi:hypothetical protein
MLNNNSLKEEVTPLEFYLSQNYPNPFKDKTIIKYCVAYKTKIQITVFNSEKKEISKLVDEDKKPGTYELIWDASNKPSGVYFYKIFADDFVQVKKMILLKLKI